MELSERRVGKIRIIKLEGQAVINKSPQLLSQSVEGRLKEGERLFVVNLAECERMDSTGLGELIKSSTLVTKNEGLLKVSNVPLRLRGLMIASNLVQVLEFFDSEQEAINSFGD
jgi:anti-anti-sigma factor